MKQPCKDGWSPLKEIEAKGNLIGTVDRNVGVYSFTFENWNHNSKDDATYLHDLESIVSDKNPSTRTIIIGWGKSSSIDSNQ